MQSELFWRCVAFARLAERAGMVVCGLSLPLACLLRLPFELVIHWWLLAAASITASALLRLWLVKRIRDD